jgi:hypothetical protein
MAKGPRKRSEQAVHGLRKRAKRRQAGPGKPFLPRQNSHDGTVFRRGPDLIPRATISAIYREVLEDDGSLAAEVFAKGVEKQVLPFRVAAARSLMLMAKSPKLVAVACEAIADRLEGRPKVKIETEEWPQVVFYREGQKPPWLTDDPPARLPAAGPEPSVEIAPPPPPLAEMVDEGGEPRL